MAKMRLAVVLAFAASPTAAWSPISSGLFVRRSTTLWAKIGTIFGTSSGSTEDVADMIAEAFGEDAAAPVNIDDAVGNLETTFAEYDALVVGTPTYNTDADRMRTATSWDGAYYDEIAKLGAAGKLKGKKVAVFGLGDQEGYEENFADGTGELHDVFESHGCTMFGYTDATSAAGYAHEASKSQRGDKFVGLVVDSANQADLTDGRVKKWVAQLIQEGFLESGAPAAAAAAAPAESAPVAPAVAAAPAAPAAAAPAAVAPAASAAADGQTSFAKPWHSGRATGYPATFKEAAASGEYVPFKAGKIKQTLWVSKNDHRASFYTFD